MAALPKPCDYTGSCITCRDAETQYRPQTFEQNFLAVHTDRSTICAGKKSKEKKTILYKLEKIISALRNSKGGQVLVHIKGQSDEDRYLEYFDEFITNSFSDLIEDGQLYVNAYSRRWLSELPEFSSFKDFLLITVKESAGIATVDFNTKVSNDIEKLRPQYLNIAEILFSHQTAPPVSPVVRGLLDVQQFHENRRIEIKAFKPKSERRTEILSSPSSIADYIWRDLKLKENLTSLSKILGGGSYFVGISEVEKTIDGYKTKTPQIDGFVVPNLQGTTQAIYDKVKEFCQVLLGDTFSDVPEDLLEVSFHPIQGTYPQKHILEVAVRFFDGIVFYDKEGPTAYEIRGNKVSRMNKTDWLKKFKLHFKSTV